MTIERVKSNSAISSILGRLLDGKLPGKKELKLLLTLSDPDDISTLFSAARRIRSRHFANHIFCYGFLYFSTYCRNNCSFCQFRTSNAQLQRYRKNEKEMLSAACEMSKSALHTLDLTMGEDPYFLSDQERFEHLLHLVKDIKNKTGMAIMLSPGRLTDEAIDKLALAGVDWYACYQETYNRQLYSTLRNGQNFCDRMRSKSHAKQKGMLVEEGLLLGAGESIDDLVESIFSMMAMGADQVRVMSYIPHPGVTFDRSSEYSPTLEYLAIAVMRLLMPDRLIPASLDVDGLKGLEGRLMAGANVITSIIPPKIGLEGVANKHLDIDESKRSVESVLPILQRCGLTLGSKRSYRQWLEKRKEMNRSRILADSKILCA